MGDLADLTNEAVGWRLIADAVAIQLRDARERLEAAMVAEHARQVQAEGSDGSDWGTATISAGKWVGVVDDLDALMAWTKTNRPDMIHTRPTLDETWIRLLVTLAAANAKGQAIDPETGAVIPGVGRTRKPGELTIRMTNAAKWGARELVDQMARGLLAISAEERDDE